MPALVRIWVLLSALLVSAGWILSALHQLNRLGYGIAFALVGATFFFFRRQTSAGGGHPWVCTVHKFRRRFRRFLPLCFLLIALMSLVGGLLYVSTETDGLAYRVPRVLHWLGQEQWHWIRTSEYRLDTAGCDFEWVFAPLILFTRTDHFIFLVNWLSYVMLPGLIFSVFIRLGVPRKAAWWWMWLLASGWCYVFQAATTINDSLVVIYALASVDLALRARERQSPGDLWLSLLAAALVTGVKQTGIPLALLWLVSAWPARGLFLQRPLIAAIACMAALLASFVPMAIINLHKTGTWSGVNMDAIKAEIHSPFWGIIGNAFCLSAQNLAPPFFPLSERWDNAMNQFISSPFGAHFADFESFGHLNLAQAESNAGIGLGICLLTLISLAAAFLFKRAKSGTGVAAPGSQGWHLRLLRLTPWLLLLVFMAKVGTYQNARQLAPYYVFLFPVLLIIPGFSSLLRQRWWQCLAMAVMFASVLLVFLSRGRPMFPAQTLLAKLMAAHPDSKPLATLANVYAFRTSWEERREFCHKNLPSDGSTVGYLAVYGGTLEPGMWLPLGRLKVKRIFLDDTLDQLRRFGIQLIVTDGELLDVNHLTWQQLAARYDARLVAQTSIMFNPHLPPRQIYIFDLQSGDPPLKS